MYSIYYFFCLDFCFSCTDSCLHVTSVFICIPTASQGKCLVWRNPIWLRLLLLPLIVLALIPSIKENIGFGPAQVSGKGDQSVGSNHSWACVYTVGMSSTYVGTYTRVCAFRPPYVFLDVFETASACWCTHLQNPRWLKSRLGQPCWGFVVTLTKRSHDCGFKWATNHQRGHTDREECWSRREEYWINKITTSALCLHWKANNKTLGMARSTD